MFVSRLVKSAIESIILVDNYINEDTLQLFSDRPEYVMCKLYTSKITQKLILDLKKFNSQYNKIEVHKFNKSHDRFLIIDEKEVYHIGASLKDLGKKWFAFSKLDIDSINLLERLEGIS